MVPVHAHLQVLSLVSAAWFPIFVFEAPGLHGPVVTGIHGAGVGVPMAAAVAAATVGFACVLHMPKGMMFFMGVKSMTFAAGTLHPMTMFSGVTTMLLGASPSEHFSIAPRTTSSAMA
jgi:hypothetical protein